MQAQRALGDSSMLAAESEGTVGAVTLSGARCPEGPTQSKKRQPGSAYSPLHAAAMSAQQQQGQLCQRPDDMPDKRQKVQGDQPEALAEATVSAEPRRSVEDASSPPGTQPLIKTKPEAEPQQAVQPRQADNQVALAMTSRVGKVGMDVIRETLMRQQALFTEQVRINRGFLQHAMDCTHACCCVLLAFILSVFQPSRYHFGCARRLWSGEKCIAFLRHHFARTGCWCARWRICTGWSPARTC